MDEKLKVTESELSICDVRPNLTAIEEEIVANEELVYKEKHKYIIYHLRRVVYLRYKKDKDIEKILMLYNWISELFFCGIGIRKNMLIKKLEALDKLYRDVQIFNIKRCTLNSSILIDKDEKLSFTSKQVIEQIYEKHFGEITRMASLLSSDLKINKFSVDESF